MKKETLEEAAKTHLNSGAIPNNYQSFIEGAKWHAERNYSEEEVYNILEMAMISGYTEELETHYSGDFKNLKRWFGQFKKK